MNAVMFDIGMFSYMCMVLIPIFCRPDWPKQLVRRWLPNRVQFFFPASHEAADNLSCTLLVEETVTKKEDTKKKNKNKKNKGVLRNWTWKHLLINLICLHYVAVQLFLPYSHFLTKVKKDFSLI